MMDKRHDGERQDIESGLGGLRAEITELRDQKLALREEIMTLRTELRIQKAIIGRVYGGVVIIIIAGLLFGWFLTYSQQVRAWLF